MKNLVYVAMLLMAMVMTSCEQSKEDYIKEFEAFVEEVAEEGADYTEEQWEKVAEEFEELVKQAETYEDLTVEEKIELAKVQAKYAGLQAKKGFNMVIDSVRDLFEGDKED